MSGASVDIKRDSWGGGFQGFLVLLLGTLSGLALILAAVQGKKWLLAAALGMIAFHALFIATRRFRIVLICMAVFFLPIRLDFHLIFKTTPYAQLTGLPVTLSDLAFGALLFFWLFEIMTNRTTVRFFPEISIPAIGYLVLSGLSAFLSQDTVLSFSMWILGVKCYFIFLYVANNINKRTEIFWVLAASALGVLGQSIMGFLQYLTGGTLGLDIFGEGERGFRTSIVGLEAMSRVGGTIGDSNTLAMYLNLILPVLLCLLFARIHALLKMVIAVIVLMGGVAELMTLSRGGWMALGIAGMAALFGVFKLKLKSVMKSAVLVVVAVGLLCGVVLAAFGDVRERLFESDYGSAYSRIPMAQVALNMIEANPLLGVGLNNYAAVMNRYDHTREFISYQFPYPVHNAYLLTAGESGIPALLCFVWVLLAALRKGLVFFRGKGSFLDLTGIGWVCGILTWMIHALFKMTYPGLSIPLWISIGIVASMHLLIKTKSQEGLPFADAGREGFSLSRGKGR